MGNIIPYSVDDIEPEEHHAKECKQSVCYLTVPSIPYPGDSPVDSGFGSPQGSLPETMDLRPLIEVPYRNNHPESKKYRANIDIIARQLECMARSSDTWKGRISRKFWEYVNPRTMNSIRDIYDCVRSYGMLPYSLEASMDKPSTRIAARPYRLIVVKQMTRNIDHIMSCIAAQCPIAISLAIYGSQPMSVYELPTTNQPLTMVIPALIVGYDAKRDICIVQGCFDSSWGEDGYIALPFEMIQNTSVVLELWAVKFSKNIKYFESDFDTISFDLISNVP